MPMDLYTCVIALLSGMCVILRQFSLFLRAAATALT